MDQYEGYFTLQQSTAPAVATPEKGRKGKRGRSRKGGRTFWRVLLWCFAGFLGITALCMALLWGYLSRYQQTLPETVADSVLAAYKSENADALMGFSTDTDACFLDKSLFTAYLGEALNPADLFYYQTGTDGDDIRYDFISAGRLLATLTLTKADPQTGGEAYRIKSLTHHPLKSYTLFAPEDCVLTLNGAVFAGNPQAQQTVDAYAELDAPTYEIVQYTQGLPPYIAQVSAALPDGTACDVNWDKETGAIVVARPMPDAARAELAAVTEETAKAYMQFATQRFASVAPVLAHVYPGTQLYQTLYAYSNDWGEQYDTDEFSPIDITEVQCYSDTEFSCRAKMDYSIVSIYGESKSFPFDFTLYWTTRNGSWQLVAMERHTEGDASPSTQQA